MIDEFENQITTDQKPVDVNQSSFLFMDDIPAQKIQLKVGIVGITGVVGKILLEVLKEREFPVSELHTFNSSTSGEHWLETPFGIAPVAQLNPRKPPELDVVFMAAGAEVAKNWGWRFARRGAIVIDKSSYFRAKKYAPLIVPEVNPEALYPNRGIIANPNCTTIPVVQALSPLHDRYTLRDFTAVTFQSVSGAGRDGIDALKRETENPNELPTAFSHRIAHNVIPYIGAGDNHVSGEEKKMICETRRILNLPRLPIRVTSVRVPTYVGHAIAIHASFCKSVSVLEVRDILAETSGIGVVDNIGKGEYPTPLDAEGGDSTLVGRIRQDRGRQGLAIWVATDNLRKGAATNAVQIAESMLENYSA